MSLYFAIQLPDAELAKDHEAQWHIRESYLACNLRLRTSVYIPIAIKSSFSFRSAPPESQESQT